MIDSRGRLINTSPRLAPRGRHAQINMDESSIAGKSGAANIDHGHVVGAGRQHGRATGRQTGWTDDDQRRSTGAVQSRQPIITSVHHQPLQQQQQQR